MFRAERYTLPKPWILSGALAAAVFALVLIGVQADAAAFATASTADTSSEPLHREPLHQIIIHAPFPQYAAPTNRDGIGRIWAPVRIDGMGPFRLVLDSGASRSGLIPSIAKALKLDQSRERRVRLNGVTGAAVVPTVHVHSFTVGDLELGSKLLPILPDAFGGAEGVLGMDSLHDGRIDIDFAHDSISITHSLDQPAPPGFYTVPFRVVNGSLIVIHTWVGGIPTLGIIDTGGEASVANLALRRALEARYRSGGEVPDKIIGVTDVAQDGRLADTPPILIGANPNSMIRVDDKRMTFSDIYFFERWHMMDHPTMLIGMDALGLLNTVIIDFRRHELQLKLRGQS